MNINEFNSRYSDLRDIDVIADVAKCDHPECQGISSPLKKVIIKRNILKHGGKEFICRDCMMRHDNPMNREGTTIGPDEIITVVCPDPSHEGPRERQMKRACYYGEMSQPFAQVCLSCSQKGKELDQESKDKIAAALTGRTLSEEHRAKISEYMTNNEEGIERGKRNLVPGIGGLAMKGKHLPQQWRDAISAGTSGVPKTQEHRDSIAAGRKKMLEETGGFTDEHRENLRKAAINQYLNGFDPNLYHLSGWHESPKCMKPVFFRSSYEKRAYELLDVDPAVKSYSCESWHVRYSNPFKGTDAVYIVDLKVEMVNGSIVHVEVKPKSMLNHAVVKAKAEAATLQAASEGSSYEIWTEAKIFGSNDPKVISEFCEKLQANLPDGEERRQRSLENYRARTKRHYDNVIAKDKVTAYCDFCKEEHSVLRVNYSKNIARNGRYICEREGGHIAGSRPKLHLRKENPYADEGKKQCAKCGCVLPLDDFGDDKSRADGKASRCKKCRSNPVFL